MEKLLAKAKEGLKFCSTRNGNCTGCPYGDLSRCNVDLLRDCVSVISQLEKTYDRAIRDIEKASRCLCDVCIHKNNRETCIFRPERELCPGMICNVFEWDFLKDERGEDEER